jgi:glutaredoxin 3
MIDKISGGTHVIREELNMPNVEIYTKFLCPYCSRAKSLLKAKNVAFEEIDITMDNVARKAMIARANGGATVPQIFINGSHIGGCDDLMALDSAGKLDPLLAG